jgi:hypothetical protein
MSNLVNNSTFDGDAKGDAPTSWQEQLHYGKIAIVSDESPNKHCLLTEGISQEPHTVMKQTVNVTNGSVYSLSCRLRVLATSGEITNNISFNLRLRTTPAGSPEWTSSVTTIVPSKLLNFFPDPNITIDHDAGADITATREYAADGLTIEQMTMTLANVQINADDTTVEIYIGTLFSDYVNYMFLIDDVLFTQDGGGGGDPHIRTIFGPVYDLPVNEFSYIFIKSLDDKLVVNIKTQATKRLVTKKVKRKEKGKEIKSDDETEVIEKEMIASYIKYVYFHYLDTDVIVDLEFLKTYMVSDFSSIKLNDKINAFTLNKDKKKEIDDISTDEIKTTKTSTEMRVVLGDKYYFLLQKKGRNVYVSNVFDQELYIGALIDKTCDYILPSLLTI